MIYDEAYLLRRQREELTDDQIPWHTMKSLGDIFGELFDDLEQSHPHGPEAA